MKDDEIKRIVESWDDSEVIPLFDKEKVWGNIPIKDTPRNIMKYYAVSAVVFLALLSVGLGFLLKRNYELQIQYRERLVKLEESVQQTETLVAMTKKKVQIKYKTKVKEIVTESPELRAKVKMLEENLNRLVVEKKLLKEQLISEASQVKVLRDSVFVLKKQSFVPELIVQDCNEDMLDENISLRVNINKKALADLPEIKRKKEKLENRIEVKFLERKEKDMKEQMAPKFVNIPIN